MSNAQASQALDLDDISGIDQVASTALAENTVLRRHRDKDYIVEHNGRRYAGVHLILDIWGAEQLDDLAHVETTLRDCVQATGATLLHIHLHHFTPNGGVSGVAVLAESHISIHTWPERDYAALDIFMCGRTSPAKAIAVVRRAFRPARLVVGEHFRGEVT
jgi:S-adenosylmethionine decarboxylase